MKKPKKFRKRSSQKDGSSSSVAAPSAAGGSRKSQWETDEKPSCSDRHDPCEPKDSPAGRPSLPFPAAHRDQSHPAGAPLHVPGGVLRHSLVAGGRPPFPLLETGPPPLTPSYDFDNLDRRTIVLADDTVGFYFALPPDYPLEPSFDKLCFYRAGFPPRGQRLSPDDFSGRPAYGRGSEQEQEHGASMRPDGHREPLEGGLSSLKRKYGDAEELAWRQWDRDVLQYGHPSGLSSGSAGDRRDYFDRVGDHRDDMRFSKLAKLGEEGCENPPLKKLRPADAAPVVVDVDEDTFKQAFLKLSKTINKSSTHRKNYLEDGKNGPLKCVVCGRTSKDFAGVHDLIVHAYNSRKPALRVDHLGLHKSLCVLMGWNYSKVPENSKVYQLLHADEALANQQDLILWPPTIIIHNTGPTKDGHMDGMGNRGMDAKLKELGFSGGKSKSVHGREGHTGITAVRFANTQAGLKEAEQLAEYFEKDNHGREGWARVQASHYGDDDNNPALVKVDEKTGEKRRVFYGYLATSSDLDKVDSDMRKKAIIKSRKELDLSD